MIDDQVINAYRHGLCLFLAKAMHQLTDWPIMLLAGSEQRGGIAVSGSGSYFVHAAVLAPDGSLLDIAGRSSMDETAAYYHEHDPAPANITRSYTWHTAHSLAECEAVMTMIEGCAMSANALRVEPQDIAQAMPYARLLVAGSRAARAIEAA